MEFILIATAHFMALLSPGPDLFLIMQAALRLRLKYVISICAGIAAANGLYLATAIIGFEAISRHSSRLLFLQYTGALYLLYIGLLLLKSPRKYFEKNSENSTSFLHKESVAKQFLLGLTSGLLNPKNIIFYFSIFTVMVSPETPFFIRALYGIWMTLLVFFWDCIIAMLTSSNRVKNSFGKGLFYMEKTAGITLASFGILLTFG